MPWVITFVESWILFFFLIDYKQLKLNIWGGIIALIMGSIVDWGGNQLDLYAFKDLVISWFGCSIFYKFGPIFVMGILFAQCVPRNKWMQVANILVASTLYLGMEYCIIKTGVAEYHHWHYAASYFIDLFAFTSLTWFRTNFFYSIPDK